MIITTSTAVIIAFLNGCGQTAKPPSEKPAAVRVMKIERKDMRRDLQYLGTVHSKQEIKVLARVQGTLQKLPFEEGQRIREGDLLAQIYAPDIKATVDRLQADKQYWQNRYESDKRLAAKQAIPEDQVDASARAFKSARAALKEAEARFAKTREYAPVEGTVLKWYMEPGQHVMPGQPILLIGNDVREVHASVVENDIKKGIEKGQMALIEDGLKRAYQARVSEIAPMARGASRTFNVKLRITGAKDFDLPVGASLDVHFILEQAKQVQVLPLNAVVYENNKPHIFLIRDSVAVKQPVKIGIQNKGLVAVSFTFQGQNYAAVSNLNQLHDGSRVYPVMVGEEEK